MSAVDQAAGILRQWTAHSTEWCAELAQALADAGLLRDDEPSDAEVEQVAALLPTFQRQEWETFGKFDLRRARTLLRLASDIRKAVRDAE